MSGRFHRNSIAVAPLAIALFIVGCGGGSGNGSAAAAITVPQPPSGTGIVDAAPVQDETVVLPYVDNAATNQRGDARYATKETNAGVRVVAGFLDLWTPSTLIVDAGVTAPANGTFPAVVSSTWTGIPGDATDGKKVNAAVLDASVQYVIDATTKRTPAQAFAAYLDDRRGKGYSITDGMGPLTAAWRTAAQQTTTITDVPADAATVLYNDGGNNTGVGSATNTAFGAVVDFVNSVGTNGSTEPAKRFYKYARPWRWSASVSVVPALVPAESGTPKTDGGFISGHAAEATRDALAMAYVVPERFQELVARALELGENRILAGMHSPLDVIGGRIQAQAIVAANFAAATPATRRAAYDQAHTVLMAAAGTTDPLAFNDYAHSAPMSADRFADHVANKANHLHRLTYGFNQIADATKPAVVPKGAEALLETRLPYLDATQRRVVLKTTALSSGYPVMDDAEGWGRLDLFAAADGFGAFSGDVTVTMDASLGGFNALDRWKNDIAGKGLLTKNGTGTLCLAGSNSYSGGSLINGGALQADSTTALGTGDVYVKAGTVICNATSAVKVGNFTQLPAGTLQLNLGDNGYGRLTVTGTATFSGGSLKVTFVGGFKPSVGDTLNIITAGKCQGTFTTISVDGFKVTATYTSTGVMIHIDA